MKNPMLYYGAIAIGIIALAVGVYFLVGAGGHHLRAFSALGFGAVLLIAGVVGMFVMKPKTAIK